MALWHGLASSEVLAWVSKLVCLPFMLMLNLALFQYLLALYYSRRRELRVRLLLLSSGIGFLSLTPFAHPDEQFVHELSDISECCCVLTFLLQITIIGRDVAVKVKLRSLKWLTLTAEFLVVIHLVELVVTIVVCAGGPLDDHWTAMISNLIEDASLVFIIVFRFYYLATSNGCGQVLRTQRLDIVLYVLLMTYQYPFIALNWATSWDWEYVQGLYMRVLITSCLGMTMREKLRASRRRNSQVSANNMVSAISGLSSRSGRSNGRTSLTRMMASSDLIAVSTTPPGLRFVSGRVMASSSGTTTAVQVVPTSPPQLMHGPSSLNAMQQTR